VKATFLSDVVTPLTPRDVMWALRAAYERVTSLVPSRDTLALLTAQSALETGRWKAIHCFNLGNVKAAETYAGFYTCFRCNEVIDGKTVWFDPPHPQTRFRAFISLEDGARDHLEFLAGRTRYASAWAALIVGDPERFVRALKLAGYFTANEESYKAAVVSLFREYSRMLEMDPRIVEPPPLPIPHRATPLAGPVSVADSMVDDALQDMSADPNEDTKPA
jgi:hypothetical protein